MSVAPWPYFVFVREPCSNRVTHHAAALAAGVLFCAPLAVVATPANKKALANHFDEFLPVKLNACTTCHLPSDNHDPQSLEEFPHNAFGRRLKELRDGARAGLTVAERLAKIPDEDADHDGATNLTELLLGTNPGDAKDKPSAADLVAAPTRHEAFGKHLARSQWEPFKPVNRPALPRLKSQISDFNSSNPIDAFIDEQLAAHNLTANPEAPPEVLIRRLYLDLIGLVPSPTEVDAFVGETTRSHGSCATYESLVEQLLARPQHGERWGRHWMDIWRYSDWDGYKEAVRISQPHIWQWRDWIVESLNRNKPYDQMVREMLAADEIAPGDNDMLRATGFLVRNYHADRYQWMDMIVEHTSKAFMGLTKNCVKCHDHKYDPLPQEDYYRIRAVFEPYNVRTDPLPGELDTAKAGLPRAYDQSLQPITYIFQRGDERSPIKDKAIQPGVPGIFSGKLDIKPIPLPLTARQPEKRDYVRAALIEDAKRAVADASISSGASDLVSARLAAAKARLAALTTLLPLEQAEDRGMNKKSPQWRMMATQTCAAQIEADLLEAKFNRLAADSALAEATATKKAGTLAIAKKKAGEAAEKLAAAEKAKAVGPKADYRPRAIKTFPDSSTGRRLAFAAWLSSLDNPLFARVAMNHLWLRHFGTGIVPTPDEFGANGKKPTHPALLDWLAAEFIDSGYDMKHMHRLIVTSAVYRRASTQRSRSAGIDPDNVHLWRAPLPTHGRRGRARQSSPHRRPA